MTSKLNDAVLLRSNDHNRSDKPELSYSQLKNSAGKRITNILPYQPEINLDSVTDIIGLTNGNILFNGTVALYTQSKTEDTKSILHSDLTMTEEGSIATIAAVEDKVFAFTSDKVSTDKLLILKDSKVEHKLTYESVRIRSRRNQVFSYAGISQVTRQHRKHYLEALLARQVPLLHQLH